MSTVERGEEWGELVTGVYLCPECEDRTALRSRREFVTHYGREHGNRIDARQKLLSGELDRVEQTDAVGTQQTRFPVNEYTELHETKEPTGKDGKEAITRGDIEKLLTGTGDRKGFYDKENVAKLPATPGEWARMKGRPRDPQWHKYLGWLHRLRLKKAEGSYMVLWNTTEREYTAIPTVIRGMGEYQARKGDKIEKIGKLAEEEFSVASLVTLSPKTPEGKSPVQTLLLMTEVINKFNAYLREHTGLDLDKYVWAAEPTERGHLHYHIVYLGVDLKAHLRNIHRELGLWWEEKGYGESQGVDLQVARGTKAKKAVLGYLVGYLNAQNNEDWFNGMVYLAGKRTFQTSQGLNKLLTGLLGEDKLKEEVEAEHVTIGYIKGWKRLVERKYGGNPPPPEKLLEDNPRMNGLWVTVQQVRGL